MKNNQISTDIDTQSAHEELSTYYLNCYDKQVQAINMTEAESEPEAEDMTMGGM